VAIAPNHGNFALTCPPRRRLARAAALRAVPTKPAGPAHHPRRRAAPRSGFVALLELRHGRARLDTAPGASSSRTSRIDADLVFPAQAHRSSLRSLLANQKEA